MLSKCAPDHLATGPMMNVSSRNNALLQSEARFISENCMLNANTHMHIAKIVWSLNILNVFDSSFGGENESSPIWLMHTADTQYMVVFHG